ncbi:MAG: uroporphyrinogen-III C-methyltransferase [Gammaproteobacteria bacterium]|nr:hypothetical protein [Gammaproteobacteria bacterium]
MSESHPGPDNAPPPPHAEPRPAPQRSPLTAAAALILAILAVGGVAFQWRQHRAVDVALDTAQRELNDALERVRATQRELSDRLDALRATVDAGASRNERLNADLDALPRRIDDLERRIESLPASIAELERRLDAVQGGTPDAKAVWRRAEAEYYLSVANAELELGGRWDNAKTALELADESLRGLADPTLAPVRRQIAADLLALESVERPDIERIVFDLASIAARVDELPLRSAGAPKDGAPPVEDVEPGLGRLVASAKRALGSLVSVERRDEAETRALLAGRRAVARRELAAELALARTAALEARQAVYAASLAAAAELLERDFDAADPGVRAAAALVAELAKIDVAPPRPDIGRSLAVLRAAGAE